MCTSQRIGCVTSLKLILLPTGHLPRNFSVPPPPLICSYTKNVFFLDKVYCLQKAYSIWVRYFNDTHTEKVYIFANYICTAKHELIKGKKWNSFPQKIVSSIKQKFKEYIQFSYWQWNLFLSSFFQGASYMKASRINFCTLDNWIFLVHLVICHLMIFSSIHFIT